MPANENTSLLHDAGDDSISTRSVHIAQRPSTDEKDILRKLVMLIIAVDFAATCMSTAVFKAEELISCREYYRLVDPSLIDHEGSISEVYCKVNHVQTRLATVVGLEAFLAAIPGILVSVLFGRLADRRGRKLVLMLNLLTYLCYHSWILIVGHFHNIFHSAKWIYLYTPLYLIGAGPVMIGSMVATIVADITPESERTTILFRLSAVESVSKLLGAVAGPSLLLKEAWLPFYVGLPFLLLSIPAVIMLPETLNAGATPTTHPVRTVGFVFPQQDESPQESCSSVRLRRAFFNIDLTDNKLIVFAIMYAYLAKVLEAYTIGFVIQYVSTKFKLSLARAGFFLPTYSAGKLLAFLIILPYLKLHLRRNLSASPASVDFLVLKGSMCMLAIGQVIIGSSPVWPLVGCGLLISSFTCGILASGRSLLASLVGNGQTGQVFSYLVVLETIGGLIAGPNFALTFILGTGIGVAGLPFLLLALISLSSALFLFVVTHAAPENGSTATP